jgi:hypothetical protein
MTKLKTPTELTQLETTKLNGRLLSMGIIPLDPVMVKEYMDAERRKIPHTPGARVLGPLVGLLDRILKILFSTATSFMMTGAAVMAISAVFGWLILIGVGVALLIIGIASALLEFPYDYGSIPICISMPANWQETGLFLEEDTPVVIRKIIEKVRCSIPSATIVVHELRQGFVVFDPVLEVRDDDGSAFLAIWKDDKIIAIG